MVAAWLFGVGGWAIIGDVIVDDNGGGAMESGFFFDVDEGAGFDVFFDEVGGC